MSTPYRRICSVLIALACGAVSLSAQQPTADPAYETFFYRAEGLRLEAYLYRPEGKGPFPLVVYNHGSRPGQERIEWPVRFVARVLVPAGYALLVPERRGYARSDGQTFSEELGQDRGPKFVARVKAESRDVLAAVTHVLDSNARVIDGRRVAVMGFSFGGMVTAFVASDPRFRAALVQAPGALTWARSSEVRAAIPKAARRIRIPTWCGVAENDAQTESTKAVCRGAAANGAATELKVYPPFTPTQPHQAGAPGHALFSAQGVTIWADDILAFLRRHMS